MMTVAAVCEILSRFLLQSTFLEADVSLLKQIQKMVITGHASRPDVLRSSEVVSMLLDDAEMEAKRLMLSMRVLMQSLVT